jgi:hypothetical protein
MLLDANADERYMWYEISGKKKYKRDIMPSKIIIDPKIFFLFLKRKNPFLP